jgi:phosphopantetheinyl transferase (holo-ACP synthase)
VGVDLEISRPRDVLRIARFAFSKEEVAALEQQADSARDHLFYTLWTMKEALAKALRLNLIDALRQCVFTRAPEHLAAASIRPTASIWPTIWSASAPTPSPWAIQVFQPRAGFFLAAACVGASRPQALRTWEWPPQRLAHWPLIAAAGAAAPAGAAALPE